MQRWMESKMAKLKRDGMAETRGAYGRWKDKPSAHNVTLTMSGWYVTGRDKRRSCGTFKTAAKRFGPFATKSDAHKFGVKMFNRDTMETHYVS